jgi:hypothetical protein
MLAYATRAERLQTEPWKPVASAVFYPWGTHYLVALARVLSFGHPGPGVALLYALEGALAATYYFLAARELLPGRPKTLLALGAFFTLYPTWIALGGFVLSEPPFTACVAATTYYALRVFRPEAPSRRAGSAVGLGVALALGVAIRPQMLLTIPIFALLALWGPRPVAPRGRSWAALGAPLALVLAISAARMKLHTGHYGLVSKNGALNFAFGRCHAAKITALRPHEAYTPPSFRGLASYEDRHGMKPFPELDPALGEEITVPGPIWDEAAFVELSKKCVRATGPLRQVGYALTHVVLLFAYSVSFPLKGTFLVVTSVVATVALLPGYLAALVRMVKKRDVGERVLLAHVFTLSLTAMVFFGEIRLRVPYDGVLAILTALYATRLASWWRARRGERGAVRAAA